MSEPDIETLSSKITPLIASQFMIGAVSWHDFDIDYLYTLERVFLKNLEQADGPTLVSMIAGHSDWA